MANEVVAREVAEAELEKFAEMLDVSFTKATADKDAGDGFSKAKEIVIGAIMDGRVSVESDGVITYQSPRVKAPLRFEEPTGHALTCLRKKEDFAGFFASVTQTTPARYLSLKRRDLEVIEAICALFLAPVA